MKKVLAAFVALLAFCACSNENNSFEYRGLPLSLNTTAFIDSMAQRGFAVDSAAAPDSTGRIVVLKNTAEKYRVLLSQNNGTLMAVQENYSLSTNDSTRALWQQLRDQLEKDLGAWPNCPILKDDHKVAKFEMDGGFVTVTLKNTYTPTLSVLYEVKR